MKAGAFIALSRRTGRGAIAVLSGGAAATETLL
jgi:hypothetical protein